MAQRFDALHRLQETTGCSFAKAQEALEQGKGTLLDAYLYLERSGHVSPPTPQSVFSTKKLQSQELSKTEEENTPSFFVHLMETLSRELLRNHFILYHRGKYISQVPVFILLISAFASWGLIFLVILGSMFYGFTYEFSDETSYFGEYNQELLSLSKKISSKKKG